MNHYDIDPNVLNWALLYTIVVSESLIIRIKVKKKKKHLKLYFFLTNRSSLSKWVLLVNVNNLKKIWMVIRFFFLRQLFRIPQGTVHSMYLDGMHFRLEMSYFLFSNRIFCHQYSNILFKIYFIYFYLGKVFRSLILRALYTLFTTHLHSVYFDSMHFRFEMS